MNMRERGNHNSCNIDTIDINKNFAQIRIEMSMVILLNRSLSLKNYV
ncbi:hypothetical protein HMPREF3232_00159 [Fannyhessea vaginae]|nr:hypothetical protein HMPREF3232_00159 [Fannyhessea vaginae]